MRGIDTPLDGTPRPIVGRDLEFAALRPATNRLHVERPCYIGRAMNGSWTWHCSLCPLPLGLIANTADDWHAAIVEATRHLRATHAARESAGTEAGRPLAA